MMAKTYQRENVYDAAMARIKDIFDNFENICVSFSGGKDSGVLLELVLKYKRDIGDGRKIGVFHQDFEAQFQTTTDYVSRIFEANKDDIEPFWTCLPVASRTAVSNFEMFWYPWDETKKDIWVRDLPNYKSLITLDNAPEFYESGMTQEDYYTKFGPWYANQKEGRSITLLGLRSDESLNRYRAVVNDSKETLDGRNWTTRVQDNLYIGYPLYDWGTEDIWIASGKLSLDYNRLYDLFYKAGLTIHQMRVASPFHESARNSLNLYRIIDPDMWAKICGRVRGANFAAIYGGTKALGYKKTTLPDGHSWKTYTKFLLQTLPEETRKSYISKFSTSIKFWSKKGGVVEEEAIRELMDCNYPIRKNGLSNRTKVPKFNITFQGIPDHTDDIKTTIDIPSWKRMCFCILKNDHLCKFMGFGQNKEEMKRRKAVVEKYKNL